MQGLHRREVPVGLGSLMGVIYPYEWLRAVFHEIRPQGELGRIVACKARMARRLLTRLWPILVIGRSRSVWGY
jgi:hypothetical protein